MNLCLFDAFFLSFLFILSFFAFWGRIRIKRCLQGEIHGDQFLAEQFGGFAFIRVVFFVGQAGFHEGKLAEHTLSKTSFLFGVYLVPRPLSAVLAQ